MIYWNTPNIQNHKYGKKSVQSTFIQDHSKIRDWRLSQSKDITRRQRPDMWKKFQKKKKMKNIEEINKKTFKK